MGVTMHGPGAVGAVVAQAIVVCTESLATVTEQWADLTRLANRAPMRTSLRDFIKAGTQNQAPPRLPAHVFASQLANGLRHWLSMTESFRTVISPAFYSLVDPGENIRYPILDACVFLVGALVTLQGPDVDDAIEDDAVRRCCDLARRLIDAGMPGLGRRSARVGRFIASDFESELFLEAMQLEFKAAKLEGNAQTIATAHTHLAVSFVACALKAEREKAQPAPGIDTSFSADLQRDRRLAAFDLLESAVRDLPADDEREECVQLLARAMQMDGHLMVLGLYLHLARREEPLAELCLIAPQSELNQMVPLRSDMEEVRWFQLIRKLMRHLAEVENVREDLQPSLDEGLPSTSWVTSTFSHHALARTVPYLVQPEDYKNDKDFIFVLYHEITHVLTTASHLGVALESLRTAILFLELRLWDYARPNEAPDDPSEIFERGVAALSTPDPAPIFVAEACLDLTRKLQILQDVWQPWFEGLAVFTELSPPAETFSLPMYVLLHLFDMEPMDSGVDVKEVEKAFDKKLSIKEIYADHVRAFGRFRLRTYLTSGSEHYLPGYLAVRSIVAAWRTAVGEPLAGARAASSLLWRTQFDTRQCVPPLNQSVKTFKDEALALQRRWLTKLTLFSKEEISGGAIEAPVAEVPGAAWKEVQEYFDTLIIEALGPKARAAGEAEDRSSGGSPEDKAIEWEPHEDSMSNALPILRSMFGTLLVSKGFLPIGEYDSPFWLNMNSGRLCCVLRTVPSSQGGGAHIYRAVSFPLLETERVCLQAEIERLRHPRMTVTRVARTSIRSVAEFGNHYLVFSYGNWRVVRLSSTRLVEVEEDTERAIGFRVSRNPLNQANEELTAPGQAGARRTKTWISQLEADGQQVLAWLQGIEALADDVLSSQAQRGDVREASESLLEFALGDSPLRFSVQAKGVEGLLGSSSTLTTLFQFLTTSSDLPQEVSDLGGGALETRHSFGYDVPLPKGIRDNRSEGWNW